MATLPELAEGQERDLFFIVSGTPLNARTVAPSSLRQQTETLPTRFALRQNQPNPLRATTTIRFDLPVGAMVRLEVFDAQGRRIETLASRYFPPGYQSLIWNPGAGGHHAGVYFYRLEAGPFRDRKKMVLLSR